jgi:EAL domain-containing protein (putative c-di-GMP-specific phosphodiesterase class I)
VSGAEALLRWQHPSRGLLPPCEFISLAEEKGFIIALGQWVLKTACLQLNDWSRSAHTAHLSLSINVSAHEFRHPKFAIRMLEIVAESGVDPRKLMLELTESSLLGSTEETVSKISVLREHGLRFSLDDFGIGYSSLMYLRNLPLDQLKIDRAFVSNVATESKDAAIVSSIITLGRNLGLTVIAEGVETVGQRDFLLGQGCAGFQGFFFGRPVSIDNWSCSAPLDT